MHIGKLVFSQVDVQTNKTFNFLANNFAIPAQTVADLYRYRWQVELFFKWIKQRLRIKSFFGTSENAVQRPDLDRYHRLDSKSDLYTILQGGLDNSSIYNCMLRLCYARKNRYFRRSHLSEAKFRLIMRYVYA